MQLLGVSGAVRHLYIYMLLGGQMLKKPSKVSNFYAFFLNNQPDAPIFQMYSFIKLYMFRTSSLLIKILTLLGSRHQKPA